MSPSALVKRLLAIREDWTDFEVAIDRLVRDIEGAPPKLLPCPRCGKKKFFHYDTEGETVIWFQVSCSPCFKRATEQGFGGNPPFEGKIGATKTQAAHNWNKLPRKARWGAR